MEVLAEATLGAVFGELLRAVLEIKNKVLMFKPTLLSLQSTLIEIAPVIKEIEQHNNELGRPKEELEPLIRLLEEGTKLVNKCSKIRWLDLEARVRYQNKLEAFGDSLVKFFIIDMQAQTARDLKETLINVKRMLKAFGFNQSPSDTYSALGEGIDTMLRYMLLTLFTWISTFFVKLIRISFTLLRWISAIIVKLIRIASTSSSKWLRFALYKHNGKKSFMLFAMRLSITWGDSPECWEWPKFVLTVRFSALAAIVGVCGLKIKGAFKTHMLSPNTLYGAYLVFQQIGDGDLGFENKPLEVFVGVAGEGDGQRRTAYLVAATPQRLGVEYAKEIGDGWMEVELGDFFNGDGEDKLVEMSVSEVKGGRSQRDILVQGIQIRPKCKN